MENLYIDSLSDFSDSKSPFSDFENKSKFINMYEIFLSEYLHQWLVAKVW